MTVLKLLPLLLCVESTVSRIIHSANFKNQKLHIYDRNLYRDYKAWEDNRYKKVSFTTEGEMCMDNCVNNLCITGWDGVAKPCIEGSEPAPVYFTTRAKNSGMKNKGVCLSRCGKFGYSYEWCLVADGWYWDYCSSEVHTPQSEKEVHMTDSKDRCEGPCLFDDIYSRQHRCVDIFGGLSKCKHGEAKRKFVEAKSIYGDRCASRCLDQSSDKHTRSHYTCYDVNRYNVYCAPPAKFKSMSFDEYREMHPLM